MPILPTLPTSHVRPSACSGDGTVDFSEFVAFYARMRSASLTDAALTRQRVAAKLQREQRVFRQLAYKAASSIFVATKGGDLALLRGKWLLQRAGFVETKKERRGRMVTSWAAPPASSPEQPPPSLPCRQEIEAACPQAFLTAEELESGYKSLLATLEANDRTKLQAADSQAGQLSGTDPLLDGGIGALPVVMVAHAWEFADAADPSGTTMRRLAAQLARDMPTFEAWGFKDVGVFFDVSAPRGASNPRPTAWP